MEALDQAIPRFAIKSELVKSKGIISVNMLLHQKLDGDQLRDYIQRPLEEMLKREIKIGKGIFKVD